MQAQACTDRGGAALIAAPLLTAAIRVVRLDPVPALCLNDLQLLTLWRYAQTQGKGGPHLRRMDRLMRAWRIDAIEAQIDEAQEQIDALVAERKPIPRVIRNAGMKATDPPRTVEIDTGDLDKLYHRVQTAWGKEVEPDPDREIPPVCESCGRTREVQDPRIHLPILDALTVAWNEVCATRASKTDGPQLPSGSAPAADA